MVCHNDHLFWPVSQSVIILCLKPASLAIFHPWFDSDLHFLEKEGTLTSSEVLYFPCSTATREIRNGDVRSDNDRKIKNYWCAAALYLISFFPLSYSLWYHLKPVSCGLLEGSVVQTTSSVFWEGLSNSRCSAACDHAMLARCSQRRLSESAYWSRTLLCGHKSLYYSNLPLLCPHFLFYELESINCFNYYFFENNSL